MAFDFCDTDARRICRALGIEYGRSLHDMQMSAAAAQGNQNREVNARDVMSAMEQIKNTIGGDAVETVAVEGRENFPFGNIAILYVRRGAEETVCYDTEQDRFWVSDLDWIKRKVGLP